MAIDTSGERRSGGESTPGESVVGRSLRIDGECEVAGRLRVEGRITGDVRAGSVEVVEGGRVDGSISGPDGKSLAQSVTVAGRIGGSVRGEHVDVQRQGEVIGGVRSTDSVVSGRVKGGLVAFRPPHALGNGVCRRRCPHSPARGRGRRSGQRQHPDGRDRRLSGTARRWPSTSVARSHRCALKYLTQ